MSDIDRIRSDVKLDLIHFFDSLKFDIDIKAQELLSDQSMPEYLREYILKLNMDLIEKVDEILNFNIEKVNDYFENCQTNVDEVQLDKEKLKKKILQSYCYFINADLLKKKKNPIGLLIMTDWYLDANQVNYLRVKYEEDNQQLKSVKFYYDEDILNLNAGIYMKNFEEESVEDNIYLSKSKIINELENIDHLDLSGIKLFIDKEVNYLQSIKDTTLDNVKHLKIVKLHGKLTEKNTLKGMRLLEHLNMTGLTEEAFNSVVDDLKSFNKIEKLILQNGQIRCLKESPFSTFHKLKELDLSNNLIESISEKTFLPLENLYRLVLRINRLQEIKDNTFKNLRHLKELDLSKNKLKTLSVNAFTGLENLERLLLSINSIKQLNKNVFKSLKNLEELDLSYNLLESLNDCQFDGMIKLKFLNLYQNVCLQKLNLDSFSGLNNLESLDMSYCSLEQLTDNTFIHLKNLKELNLASTNIRKLTEFTFNGLHELIRLNLANCNFESIDKNAFNSCRKVFHQKDEALRMY